MQHPPEHVDGEPLHTGTHGDHAEIGGLGEQGGDQRAVELGGGPGALVPG